MQTLWQDIRHSSQARLLPPTPPAAHGGWGQHPRLARAPSVPAWGQPPLHPHQLLGALRLIPAPWGWQRALLQSPNVPQTPALSTPGTPGEQNLQEMFPAVRSLLRGGITSLPVPRKSGKRAQNTIMPLSPSCHHPHVGIWGVLGCCLLDLGILAKPSYMGYGPFGFGMASSSSTRLWWVESLTCTHHGVGRCLKFRLSQLP